jgi:hypothetical protein
LHLTIAVVALAASTGASCRPDLAAAVVALVDLSGSIQPATVDFYAAALVEDVLEQLDRSDRLAVLPVDSAAEQRREAIFEVDLARQIFSNDRDGLARREERERERRVAFLAEQAKSLEAALKQAASDRRSFRTETDLVGALNAVPAVFPAADAPARRVLIVFSDMVQESREADISRLNSAEEAEALVARLATAGRVPQLQSVRVIVVGAGETDVGPNAAVGYRAVRAFWMRFFAQAGAHIEERDYGYRTQGRIRELIHAR